MQFVSLPSPEAHKSVRAQAESLELHSESVPAPLFFEAGIQERIWGGRQLESVFGKKLPGAGEFGESWEISAHATFVTRVRSGPYQGLPLTDLWQQYGARISPGHSRSTQFPLLIKFLDCKDRVSIQVHPDDADAQRLLGESRGKSECWIVLKSAPASRVYAGFKAGVTRRHVEQCLVSGGLADLLHSFHPEPGDIISIPAGTVHSIGNGVLLLEVQQSSDATFRMDDWGRVGKNGKARELHTEASLQAINWSQGPIATTTPTLITRTEATQIDQLLDVPQFKIQRHRFEATHRMESHEVFLIVAVVSGETILTSSNQSFEHSLCRGDVVMLPASTEKWHFHSSSNTCCEIITITSSPEG